jgi:hypothetical protein
MGFSISLVNAINVVHFVHSCNDEECIGGDHDCRNDLCEIYISSRPFNYYCILFTIYNNRLFTYD